MNPGLLNKRIEIWGKTPFQNEAGVTDFNEQKLKTVWANLESGVGSRVNRGSIKRGQAETEYTDVNHLIRIRHGSFDVKEDNWIIYNQLRFDIKYIVRDFNKKRFIDLHCSLITE